LESPDAASGIALPLRGNGRTQIGDEFTVTPTRFVAEDDTVVATGTYSWKHRTTGKPAAVQMARVWTFRDGKVISTQQHVDTLKVQERSN
jgi:ketosteroid isomerase-like protein